MEQEFRQIQYEVKQLKKTVEELPTRIEDCISENNARCVSLNKRVEQAEAQCKQLADAFNEAIKTINNFSERLTALESNYDPTVIK